MPRGKWKFSNFYASGIVMGLSPRDINAMTIWEYQACSDGWKAAHQSEEKAPPMSDEFGAELGIEGF